jgi:hypothetical protein
VDPRACGRHSRGLRRRMGAREVLEAEVEALRDGKTLPYIMYDAFDKAGRAARERRGVRRGELPLAPLALFLGRRCLARDPSPLGPRVVDHGGKANRYR